LFCQTRKAEACHFWEKAEQNSAKAAFCLKEEDMPEGVASGKNSPCVEQEGDVRLQAADTWE